MAKPWLLSSASPGCRPSHTFTHSIDPLIPLEQTLRHYKANPLATYRARQAAGWTTNSAGWISPCGMSEDKWAAEGYPFPEEPGFAEWFSAFWHHEALDNDMPPPTLADAYPNRPGTSR
jgi:hypothetical protein